MPMTSFVPRLDERKERPETQVDIKRPEKKIRSRAHIALYHKSYPDDEGEIDDQNGSVDQAEVNGLHRIRSNPIAFRREGFLSAAPASLPS
jgi:hypothetical protein